MDAFIARQPVFDEKLEVYAYELLFRSGSENSYIQVNPDQACSSVIAESLLLPGFARLTSGKPGFVSISHGCLMRGEVQMLPPASTILMIQESIDAEDEVIEACRRLKSKGYRIALDNCHLNAQQLRLVDLADIVKVDVPITGMSECRGLARFLQPKGTRLFAEHIQTKEAHQELLEAGYHLFQGNFFAQPTVVKGRDVPASKMSYLRLLSEIHRQELDLPNLARVIEREVSLTYKLLRYVNSAYFGWNGEIHSINQALLLLGEREIKRWASVIALAGMSSDKPSELHTEALLRGRLCELVAQRGGMTARAGDLFLMGLFSLMDAMLDHPMDQILDGLPLARDVKQAMLGSPGPLQDIFALCVAYIHGQWDDLNVPMGRVKISEMLLPALYGEALHWSSQGGETTALSLAA